MSVPDESELRQKQTANTSEPKKRDSKSSEEHSNSQGNTNTSFKITGYHAPKDFEPLPLTLKEIREAVPKRCFERSYLYSFAYVVIDLVALSALVYAASFIDVIFSDRPLLRYMSWLVYSFVAGAVGTGVWVLAHECGHGAFSPSTTVNNVTGFVLHSALLVPFYSWKYSHSRHHKATGHLEKDQVFVPKPRSARSPADIEPSESPLLNLVSIVQMLIFGWPAYLINNTSSGQNYGAYTNHFNPWSKIYSDSQRFDIVKSDLGLVGAFSALAYWGINYGWINVLKYYFLPYVWVNAWLVCITYLQHTDPQLPHYTDKLWTFALGANATVDRSYGILDYFFHHIADTHVAHHFFSTIPHYHAEEATRALKKVLGAHYNYSHDSVPVALWKNMRTCKFIEDDGDILFYSSK